MPIRRPAGAACVFEVRHERDATPLSVERAPFLRHHVAVRPPRPSPMRFVASPQTLDVARRL